MLSFFLPKQNQFFVQFSKQAALCVEAAKLLEKLLADPTNVEEQARRIKQLEHDADEVAHQTIDMVHATFVTPLERGDILRLVSRIDDVVDLVEGTSQRLALYDIHEIRSEAPEMARVLTLACEDLVRAIAGLADLKNPEAIRKACVDVNKRENEADTIHRMAIARLFKEATDPLYVIKWKEIFETIEGATDRCEDVANLVDSIVVENG